MIRRSERSGLGLGVVGNCSGESGLPLDTTRVCLGPLGCHGYDMNTHHLKEIFGGCNCCSFGAQHHSPGVRGEIIIEGNNIFKLLV